jgi:hypothetical protein
LFYCPQLLEAEKRQLQNAVVANWTTLTSGAQLPESQHQGASAEKAWHADCCVVAAARFDARKFI